MNNFESKKGKSVVPEKLKVFDSFVKAEGGGGGGGGGQLELIIFNTCPLSFSFIQTVLSNTNKTVL